MAESEFSSRRLTVARQRRKLTKTELATRIGVTAAAVTQYEDGKHQPEIARARKIADELAFPLAFFYRPDIDAIDLASLSFRSRRSMTAGLRDKTRASCEIATDVLYPVLSKRFRLPAINIPDLSGEEPDSAARMVREHWGLGPWPISSLLPLLEAKGIRLFWFDEDSPVVDAVCFWRDAIPFILLSNRDRGGERVRFDLAHELAHLILHRGVTDLDEQAVEAEADRFASAFLLPADQFRAECPKYPTLLQLLDLKPRWKVSLRAMVRRSRDIGILSQWQYECGQREIMRNQWQMSEPGRLDPETSEVYRLIFDRLVEKRVYPEDVAREMGITVEELVGYIPTAEKYADVIKEDLPRHFLTIEELGYQPTSTLF